MSENALHPRSVKFNYLKSHHFRVIHVDGVIGGPTPSRDIFVSLFSQRGALPRLIEMSVTAEGTLGHEVTRTGLEGIVREMEVGVSLSAQAAKEIAAFLMAQVKLLEESLPEPVSSTTDEQQEDPKKAKLQ